MYWIKSKWPFIIFILLSLCVFILTIYVLIFNLEWKIFLIALYTLLIIIIILTIIFRRSKKIRHIGSIEEFEKSLKGGLYHFKCPTCNGIFALKKSKSNNKRPIKMNCPDCGSFGIIPPNPVCIKEDIPEKKSRKANFRCMECGEGITVWAEGKDLYDNIIVYSCPFCGVKKNLNRF